MVRLATLLSTEMSAPGALDSVEQCSVSIGVCACVRMCEYTSVLVLRQVM